MTRTLRGITKWTIEDLGSLPDTGLQYELLDGVLHVNPLPTVLHQVIRMELALLLRQACPPDLYVLGTQIDWQPDRCTSLQPDVLVFPKQDLDDERITGPLVLAVEVLSPATRYRDTVLKRAKYQSAGVGSYWVIDPSVPSILVGDLVDGVYEVVGEARRDECLNLHLPYPVTVTPSALSAPRRRFSTA